MGFGGGGTGSFVLPDHKHSSTDEDGGVLDADVTEVDLTTLDDYTGVMTTKGDILGYDTEKKRIPIGTDDQILTVDSSNALGVAWKDNTASRIATGTYTGDGSVNKSITGIGFQPKYVMITKRVTTQVAVGDREYCFTTDQIVDDNVNGMAINYLSTPSLQFSTDMITSLDSDGFTVDDQGIDRDPNSNGVVYNYLCIG